MIKRNLFIGCVGVFVACKGTPTEVEIDNKIAQPEKDWSSDITGQWTEARKRSGQKHWVVDVPCEGGVSVLKILLQVYKLKVSLAPGLKAGQRARRLSMRRVCLMLASKASDCN